MTKFKTTRTDTPEDLEETRQGLRDLIATVGFGSDVVLFVSTPSADGKTAHVSGAISGLDHEHANAPAFTDLLRKAKPIQGALVGYAGVRRVMDSFKDRRAFLECMGQIWNEARPLSPKHSAAGDTLPSPLITGPGGKA